MRYIVLTLLATALFAAPLRADISIAPNKDTLKLFGGTFSTDPSKNVIKLYESNTKTLNLVFTATNTSSKVRAMLNAPSFGNPPAPPPMGDHDDFASVAAGGGVSPNGSVTLTISSGNHPSQDYTLSITLPTLNGETYTPKTADSGTVPFVFNITGSPNINQSVGFEITVMDPVPEPSSLTLSAAGALCLIGYARWRRRAVARTISGGSCSGDAAPSSWFSRRS
jgi:hypothetical protein